MKVLWKTATAVALATLFGSTGARAADAVRIGVPTALTGPYGDLGDQVRRAVTFAADEANASGGVDGRTVDTRFLDTQAKADVARQQAEKLALGGHNLMLGAIASGEALAISPMLDRWNALYISTTNKANELTGSACTARFFRVNRLDAADAAVVKPWLETRKEAKWAIVAADTAWGRNSGGSFAATAKAGGREVVSEAYPPFGTNDYAPYIQAVANSGAQGLWVALAGRDAINFATQAKQFGLLDQIFVAGVSFVTDNTVKTLGPVSKGINGIINYSATLDTPANRKFVAAWARKYPGTEPTNFEGETYVAMQILFDAIRRSHSIEPKAVATAMAGGTFETILGSQLMRGEDHQLVAPNYFGVVGEQEGRLKPVIELTLSADVATPPVDPACKMKPL